MRFFSNTTLENEVCRPKSGINLYPFGMEMPGRKWQGTSDKYRYGFNDKETDKELFEGFQNYGFRVYDSRLGRFLSVDPLAKHYAYKTPYDFAENDVIRAIDLDGAEKRIVVKVRDNSGKIIAMRVASNIANLRLQDQVISAYNSGTGTWSQNLVDNNNNKYNGEEVVVFDYDVNGNLTISFNDNLDDFEEIVTRDRYREGPNETSFVKHKNISHPNEPSDKYNDYYRGVLKSPISSTYIFDLVTYGPRKEGIIKNAFYGDRSSTVWQTTNTTLRNVFNNNFKLVRPNTTNSVRLTSSDFQPMIKVIKGIGNALNNAVGNAFNKVVSWLGGLFHKDKATPPPSPGGSRPSY